MKRFEQVSSDDHQMSVAVRGRSDVGGGGRSPGLMSGKGLGP